MEMEANVTSNTGTTEIGTTEIGSTEIGSTEIGTTEIGSTEIDALKLVEETVDKLFVYQEQYFEHHKLEEASLKHERIKTMLEKTLQILEENKDAAMRCNRAKYHYHYGRAYNVLPTFSLPAEESLAKAVKLDPRLVPAWNDLGECYWKRDNVSEAKNCFEKALSQEKNKYSLRYLSMLVRQEPGNSYDEKLKNVEDGVNLARQAVEMDASDGVSWTILGNAYLAAFFAILQNPYAIKKAMSAYAQAEKDPSAKNNPDLHFNKAVAYKYEEDYGEALISFSRAIERDPIWESPRNKRQQLLTYLDGICEMIRTKGRLKAKKVKSLLQSLDNKHLGPYDGGQYTAISGNSCKLQHIELSQLQPGINTEKVVMGKVVCSIRDEDNVPFTFCLMDKEETVVAVTVYNIAQGQGVLIGDSVAIPEPYFTNFDFTFSNKVYKFTGIRVHSPLVLVVNSKKVGREKLASAQLTTFKMPH